LNKTEYKSIAIGLYLWILIGGILILTTSETALSQSENNDYSQDLVVGELFGKIDPRDLWQFIQNGYYPVLSTNSAPEIGKIKDSDQEVIYQVRYPGANFSKHPRRIIFKFFESENSLIAAMIKEEIDFVITESYATAEEVIKSTASFTIHFRYKNPNHVKMIAYNNQNSILKNPNVRRALTYAIDRNYILEKILGRTAYLADGPLSHESMLHISGVNEYKFHPRKAIQLLLEDNWKDSDGDDILDKNGLPFRISIIYEKGVSLEEHLATRLKIAWNKIGVDVIRKPLIKSEIKKNLLEGNYDATLTSHIFEETIESFEAFFGSKSPENILGYKNRRVDHLISLYKLQKEPGSRRVMLQAILKQVNVDQAGAFLFFLWIDRYFVNRNKFANFQAKGKLLPFTEWELRN